MPEGTGLDKFAKAIPDRMFDVGIAEEHAVPFCGGLATQGIEAGARDLFDLPAARIRPGLPRRRDHGSARRLRPRPRRHRRPGRPDAPRHLRHGLPAGLPEHDLHGPEGRERAAPHGEDRVRTRPSDVAALPARQRLRRRARCRDEVTAGRQGRGDAGRGGRRRSSPSAIRSFRRGRPPSVSRRRAARR